MERYFVLQDTMLFLLHCILVPCLIYMMYHVLRLLLLFLGFGLVQILQTLLRITIFASPLSILFHSSYLSPTDSLLCRSAIFSSPNLAMNLSTICGVSDISGTSTIAVFCFSSTFPISCRYISVFPRTCYSDGLDIL